MTARPASSPYARALARDRGLSLEALVGSGPGGRIVARDVPAGTAPARAAGNAAPVVSGMAEMIVLRRRVAVDGSAPLSVKELTDRITALAPGLAVQITDLRGYGLDWVDAAPAETEEAALGLAGGEATVTLSLTCKTRRLSAEDGALLLARLADILGG